jgi:hypothetical protein
MHTPMSELDRAHFVTARNTECVTHVLSVTRKRRYIPKQGEVRQLEPTRK